MQVSNTSLGVGSVYTRGKWQHDEMFFHKSLIFFSPILDLSMYLGVQVPLVAFPNGSSAQQSHQREKTYPCAWTLAPKPLVLEKEGWLQLSLQCPSHRNNHRTSRASPQGTELLCSAATNSEALGSRRGELSGAHTMGDTLLQSTLLVIF